MRVAISNLAWEPADDDAVATLLHEAGVDAIDVAPGKYLDVQGATPGEVSAVRRAWSDRGVAITGMQSLLFGTDGLALFAGAESRRAMLDHLVRVCEVGAGLGATRLVFGSPRNRLIGTTTAVEAAEIALAFFDALGEAAGRLGVVVCLEPNPREYGATYLVDTDEAAALVRTLAHPAIRLQLDLGASQLNGEDVASTVRDHGSLVAHVHVSAPQLAPVADSPFLAEAAAAVTAGLADRVACIEMLTGDRPLEEIATALRVTTGRFGT